MISVLLMLGLAVCGNKGEEREAAQKQEQAVLSTEPAQDETNDAEDGHILIAYFSVPEDVDTSGVDAVAGASIVVKEDEVYGNTEYAAKIIQETAGGDLFRIETTAEYPLDHDPLVDQAADEQDENAPGTEKPH